MVNNKNKMSQITTEKTKEMSKWKKIQQTLKKSTEKRVSMYH